MRNAECSAYCYSPTYNTFWILYVLSVKHTGNTDTVQLIDFPDHEPGTTETTRVQDGWNEITLLFICTVLLRMSLRLRTVEESLSLQQCGPDNIYLFFPSFKLLWVHICGLITNTCLINSHCSQVAHRSWCHLLKSSSSQTQEAERAEEKQRWPYSSSKS